MLRNLLDTADIVRDGDFSTVVAGSFVFNRDRQWDLDGHSLLESSLFRAELGVTCLDSLIHVELRISAFRAGGNREGATVEA